MPTTSRMFFHVRFRLESFRLHDLRHSFASDALIGGVPLAIVGEMLGHRQASTTKRATATAGRLTPQ